MCLPASASLADSVSAERSDGRLPDRIRHNIQISAEPPQSVMHR